MVHPFPLSPDPSAVFEAANFNTQIEKKNKKQDVIVFGAVPDSFSFYFHFYCYAYF